VIVAGGYVRDEFEMYGVPLNERASRVTETIATLRAAFTGDPFEFRGRKVRITPEPYRPGGPSLLLGGSSEPAARRAARIADGFIPSVPEVWDFYRDEMQQLGRPDPGPSPIGPTRTVALAEDPATGWAAMAPYFLHETNAYGSWLAQNNAAGPYRPVADLAELKASGEYAVLTPEQHVAELAAAPFPFVMFHPLCGGMPPELAWSSLRLFEQQVVPAFG
jgi:alkanesulfonate monooxygenase SsuD/methylene tetrahydromethanopterin reductase-like flavin-dependent oxidoreductase (luciferase family)